MTTPDRRDVGDPAPLPPGARYAMSIIHPGPPALRVRYRQGVLVTPHGYPDWPLCARAVVELPPPVDGLTLDEARVVDVLAANLAMARAAAGPDGDPLWSPAQPGGAVATPSGWCWAHVAHTRQLALVPIELHGAFRHAGGVRTMGISARGLSVPSPAPPVPRAPGETVPDDVLDLLERLLGWPLPPAYRRFLAETNGAGPAAPGVLPGFGFVADQPLFGLARTDRHQELSYVREWVRDRLTLDFLPIGYVQGGLLAVKVSGDDLDSIWYYDDDDPRDRDDVDAAYICTHLLRRCADTIDEFLATLVAPPPRLLTLAEEWVAAGCVTEVREDAIGAGLPTRMRAPWQPPPASGQDPLTALFEAR